MYKNISSYSILKMTNRKSTIVIFSIFLSSFISMSVGEYRKLIPKCDNSCLTNGESNQPTNCFCDSNCSLVYNDCCLDAPTRTFRVTTKRSHNINCVFVHGENRNFWMVDTCKSSWTGHEHVREKCTETNVVSGDSSDIIGALPVTDVAEGVTYKNYYCSLCNGALTEDLIEWQVKALCTDEAVNQEDILRNLTFLEDKQQWGVWKSDPETQTRSFHECQLLFQVPKNLSEGVRQCQPNMVSTCPRSWPNMSTRRKCKSYMDPVRWSDGPVFRNVDCAICHNRNMTGFKCVYDVARGSNQIMLSRTMNVDLSAMGQWF